MEQDQANRLKEAENRSKAQEQELCDMLLRFQRNETVMAPQHDHAKRAYSSLSRIQRNDPTYTSLCVNDCGNGGGYSPYPHFSGRSEYVQALAIVLRRNTTVTSVQLSGRVVNLCRQALADALSVNTSVTSVTVINVCEALADALSVNTSVTVINVCEALADALSVNTSVTVINVCEALADILLVNNSVTTVDIRGNPDEEANVQSIKALADALRVNTAVTTISFQRVRIGHESFRCLADEVNTAITSFSFSYLKGTAIPIGCLADALKVNTTITSILLDGCQIGDEAVQALAAALRVNKTLTTLRLTNQVMGIPGAKALVDALRINTSVTSITVLFKGISDVEISSVVRHMIWQMNELCYRNQLRALELLPWKH